MTQFDWSVIARNLPWLWQGMELSLLLTLFACIGGIALGTALAVARLSPLKVVSLFAELYVDTFRSIPLVLAVFWFYFLVPLLVGHPIGPFYSVLAAFVFFEGAYFSEIVRAGIQSIRRGQVSAALATGLSFAQVLRYVVLPQAFRHMAPILMTRCIVIFQETSLAYVVSLTDFLTAASIIADRDGRPVELYLFVGAVYFTVCSVVDFGIRWSQGRSSDY
jgi:glutamate/aspartate transport system permease protein